MIFHFRNYQHPNDYQRISEFLIQYHQPGNLDGNWLEPAWEYMHSHPALDAKNLGKIGIWEDSGGIAAVCTYESQPGEAFFQFRPDSCLLREEMLAYAEFNLSGISRQDGKRYLCAYINDFDKDFQKLAQSRGYGKDPKNIRALLHFDISSPFPAITLPGGFRLTSLAEECDWAKVHQVLWRGFDHGDDVPMNAEEYESRRAMFETPKARRDLKIAIAAPDSDFASFCGMFYEPAGKFAYVEPVATNPRYRRLGLGKAAVLEGLRRCGALGATEAFVGNDLPIYRAIGFKEVYKSECWVKHWE